MQYNAQALLVLQNNIPLDSKAWSSKDPNKALMYWHRCSSHTSPEFADAVVLLGSRGRCPGLGSETMAVSSSSSASVLHASLLMDYRVHLTRTSPHHLSNKELLSCMILPKLGSQLGTPPPRTQIPGFHHGPRLLTHTHWLHDCRALRACAGAGVEEGAAAAAVGAGAAAPGSSRHELILCCSMY